MRLSGAAAQPLRRPRAARRARLAARRRLQRRALGAAHGRAGRALLADRARAAGGAARGRSRARGALQEALRRARARGRRARAGGAARAHRRRARLRARLPDGARRRAPLRQRAQAGAHGARVRARPRPRPRRLRRSDAALRRARPERGRRPAGRWRGRGRADDDPRRQGPRVPGRVRARPLARRRPARAVAVAVGPDGELGLRLRDARGKALERAGLRAARRPRRRRPTRPRAIASPTSPGRARATGCCSAAGWAAGATASSSACSASSGSSRRRSSPASPTSRSRGVPVRVHVHTAESLAVAAGARGRSPRSRSPIAPDGQLSLFDVPPAVRRAGARCCRRRSRRCRTAALHVPRALSYSALALHDRCGFSYYAERVIGLRPRRSRGGAAAGRAARRCAASRRRRGRRGGLRGARARRSRDRRGARRTPGRARRSAARMRAGGRARPRAAVRVRRGRRRAARLARHLRAQPPTAACSWPTSRRPRWRAREPEAVVESEYALQRAIYALAALRSGAPAAEIAFCFLERPDAAGHAALRRGRRRRGSPARCGAAIGAPAHVRLRRALRRPLRDLPGARPPLPGAGLAEAASPREPSQRRPRRPRTACGRSCAACASPIPTRAARSTSRRRGSCSSRRSSRRSAPTSASTWSRRGSSAAIPIRRRSPTPTRARSPRRSSRRASTTRRRARCAAPRWPCSSATTARCRARTEQLVRLPGVGRKTAAVVSGNAFGRREGIAVDTHVGRLTRRLGLTLETDPEKVERELMAIVPRPAWVEWSHLLIWHGRAVCISRAPRCRRVRAARSVSRGSDPCAARAGPGALRDTTRSQTARLAWHAWIDSTSSSTPTASRVTHRGSPTSSRPPACA